MSGSNRFITGSAARRALTQATAPLEKEVQIRLFQYMATLRVGNGALADYAYAVPNGTMLAGSAKQRAQYMQSLKNQGLRPGVSDICIALPIGKYHGAYIETKRSTKEHPSVDQAAWLLRMDSAGYFTGVAGGFDVGRVLIWSYYTSAQ